MWCVYAVKVRFGDRFVCGDRFVIIVFVSRTTKFQVASTNDI